jgi:hypothetical protein
MIEDIEYLKNNCENDAAVIYVDSGTRDRNFYPYPAEYTLDFEQPYKLVSGFDVLDAAIPTTMWNIDTFNGTLALTTVVLPDTYRGDLTVSQKYFKEIANVSYFSQLFERNHIPNSINENFIYIVSQEWYANQVEIIPNVAPTPYYMFVRKEYTYTDEKIKVSTKYTDPSSYYMFTFQGTTYYTMKEDNDELLTILAADDYYLYPNNDSTYTIVSFQHININNYVYQSITNENEFVAQVNNYYKVIDLGNYDITTLRGELNRIWNDFDISFESTSVPDRKRGVYKITSSSHVVVNANIGKLIKQLGFDTLPTSQESDKYSIIQVGSNKQIFASVYNSEDENFVITAPGIVNLQGERYLILRCKEIEDHLLGSYAYMKYTPGIGLFKLAAQYNDITNLRFDFYNLVRKPFHPIGKLPKLSFRFETQDGNLYDFKGVNHQLLIVIKFLTPTQKATFSRSILNPNYDANYMQYMSTSKSIQYKEDSDEEEEYTNTKQQQEYKKAVEKYDYSTSGSDDGDDTDDSEVEFDFSRKPR